MRNSVSEIACEKEHSTSCWFVRYKEAYKSLHKHQEDHKEEEKGLDSQASVAGVRKVGKNRYVAPEKVQTKAVRDKFDSIGYGAGR